MICVKSSKLPGYFRTPWDLETTDVRDKSVRDEWSLRDKFLDRDQFLWDRDRKDRDKTKLRDTDVTKFSAQQTVS